MCCVLLIANQGYIKKGLLPRRQAEHIVHVGLLEMRKGTTSCGIM